MLHCGNYNPVPLAHSTISYSVTLPVLPFQNPDLTEQHNSLCSYSGNASQETCQKCRLEKKDSLNRQLCELVKKHGLLEIVGKEILGWYMLLPSEDRSFIKEYGHISNYIKDHPSLLITDNLVHLKRESTKTLDGSSKNYLFSTEDLQSQEDNIMTDYCDRMLRGTGHTDTVPEADILWFDRDNDFKKGEFDLENKSLDACGGKSLPLETWDTSTEEPEITFDTDGVKVLDVSHNQEKTHDLKRLAGVTNELFAEEQINTDYQAVSNMTSECGLSCHVNLTISKDCNKHESSLSKGYENPDNNDRSLHSKGKYNGLQFEGSEKAVVKDEMKSIPPWLKCLSDVADCSVDNDCSSLDDETFFSVKSGSFYSRSSSPFSLDDSTDVEQCLFEETLEDLPNFSFYRQSPCASGHPLLGGPSSQSHRAKHLTKQEMQFLERTTIDKTHLRDVACNTDLSWVTLSYDNKETQTYMRCIQDIGVNTDPTTAPKEIRNAKDVEESKGTKDIPSSVSSDALLQRAVKAELHLVDVQRWLCWQMCWKIQQETIEKQSFFNLDKEPGEASTSVTSFNLSSALAEVEEKYQEMRTRVKSGTPLDALVPLSMQLATVDSSTENLIKDTFQLSGKINVSNIPDEDLKRTKYMKDDLKESIMSCPDRSNQKTAEICPTEHVSEKPIQYYVHVGNVAHCVKEIELMDLFQKYHVSNIFLEESSLTCGYAVLTFPKSEEAQAAVREMDGKMLYGRKLKVRSVKTSTCNLSLSFEKIKSVSTEIPQDGKGLNTAELKESLVSDTPKIDSTQPGQDQHDHSNLPPGYGNLPNVYVNTPNNNFYSPFNTYQGISPHGSLPGYSNFMGSGYQCMLQSHQSRVVSYNTMPNFMYVPFSYPVYKLPNHSPFQPSVTHTTNCAPVSNIKSNVYIQFGKDEGGVVHAKPVKSLHSMDRHRHNSRTARSVAHNKMMFSADKTKISGSNATAKFIEDTFPMVKTVNEQSPTFTFSVNAKLDPSKTTSQDIAPKIPVTTASVPGEESTAAESLPSCDKQTHCSGLSDIRSTTPLRHPTSHPPSVSIPEAKNPAVYTSAEGLTSSKQDYVSAEIQDWGVYPKLTSSEVPAVVIPNKLNFSQFKKVVKYLSEKHRGATREQIVGALEEVRRNRGGSFGCMTIPEIILAASSNLAGNVPPA